jgi:hypothetical protein
MGFWEDYFEPKYFFVAFFIGMFLVYITVPTPEVIIRYPTPHNAGKVVYKDSADVCYVYDSKEVGCPSSGVIETPLQHMNNKDKNAPSFWSKIVPSFGKNAT